MRFTRLFIAAACALGLAACQDRWERNREAYEEETQGTSSDTAVEGEEQRTGFDEDDAERGTATETDGGVRSNPEADTIGGGTGTRDEATGSGAGTPPAGGRETSGSGPADDDTTGSGTSDSPAPGGSDTSR